MIKNIWSIKNIVVPLQASYEGKVVLRLQKMIKKLIIISLVCIVSFGFSVSAQEPFNSSWNSTSSMMQSGSAYSSQVSPVGADNVGYSASTTYDSPSRVSNRRNGFDMGAEANQSEESPVGDSYILLLFAAVAMAVTVVRRRKA